MYILGSVRESLVPPLKGAVGLFNEICLSLFFGCFVFVCVCLFLLSQSILFNCFKLYTKVSLEGAE